MKPTVLTADQRQERTVDALYREGAYIQAWIETTKLTSAITRRAWYAKIKAAMPEPTTHA